MKILYISQYFPPEMGAPAARAGELSQHWAKAGHEVTVLTGFPNHPTGVVHADYRKKLRRLQLRERVNGVDVVRTWLWPLPNRKSLERMANYLSFCISAAASGMFLRRSDVVIASSPQLLVGLSGWWVSRCRRIPFVLEVRDLWPESLAAVGMARDSLLHSFLTRVARFLYRHSEHIVVVTPAFKDHLIGEWQVPSAKITVIPNGVETALFRPLPDNQTLRDQLGARDKFVVCYIGTMGWAHGLETMIEAADALQASRPDILFLLLGEGADKERILSLARAKGLKNIRVVGQQPREQIPSYINASDVCLVLLKKTDVFKTVIPTKMLEFMACGRPVILAVEGQARSIVQEAGAGISIEPENAKELALAILALAEDRQQGREMGKKGREYIVRNFSRGQTARAYADLLATLLSQR